jgi:hypothetical protein
MLCVEILNISQNLCWRQGEGAEIAYGSEILRSEMSQYIKHFILVNLCFTICRITIINNRL